MPELLSSEWFDEAQRVLAELEATVSVDLTVRYEVSSTPHGKVAMNAVIAEGRIRELVSGPADQADVIVSCSFEVAADLLAGRRDPHREYMTGGLKVEGAYAVWLLDLHPLRQVALPALATLA